MIRHSEPTYEQVTKEDLRGYGRELGGLTARGIQIAQQRAQDPRLKDVQLILASPYTRAMQTALELVRYHDIPLKVELDLREWQPDMTGRRADKDGEAMQAYAAYQASPLERSTTAPLPYETVPELRQRALAILQRYATDYDCIVCVTHGELIHQLTGNGNLNYCDVCTLTINPSK